MVKLGQTVIYRANPSDEIVMRHHPYCNKQDYLPATVVAKWSDTTVNLDVHFDGDVQGFSWKTSVYKGSDKGQWMTQEEYEKLTSEG